MSKINDGGPAFPQSDVLREDGAELVRTAYGGMSLRDWFAGQALQGRTYDGWGAKDLAEMAYEVADAMLVARGEEP